MMTVFFLALVVMGFGWLPGAVVAFIGQARAAADGRDGLPPKDFRLAGREPSAASA